MVRAFEHLITALLRFVDSRWIYIVSPATNTQHDVEMHPACWAKQYRSVCGPLKLEKVILERVLTLRN